MMAMQLFQESRVILREKKIGGCINAYSVMSVKQKE